MPDWKYNPDEDIPDLSGKVILITGGTSGVGLEAILQLAKHNPSRIYFSGRNSSRANQLISRVKESNPAANLIFVQCDLTSLDSVKAAAQQLDSDRLDVLMCNAGIAVHPAGLSKDGYEIQFATNQLGHSLLIKLLLPKLRATAQTPDADVRIVMLSSTAANIHTGKGIGFESLKTTQYSAIPGAAWYRYGQSKLANLLYAAELARRYPEITSVAVHPGVVKTDMVANFNVVNRVMLKLGNWNSMMTAQEGAFNQLWAATCDKSKLTNGQYYEPVGVVGRKDKLMASEELAKKLWDWTEKELEGY